METMQKYGHGTPDDWLENNVYTRFPWQGVAVMLIINLALFGAIGLSIWAVQMLWIPVTAAGVINGIGLSSQIKADSIKSKSNSFFSSS